ncbi:hypothetical protein AAL_08325 [Moelleriella libera RCEF 2490]|uniref:Uncharacterized protein n=1 Tax=Moelleriella libera RCEF 2490 TaxID=1081109 RepID=A0A167VKG3_9HYPO|nr:hypothetical protein AAL_08325 [Moelleriella libera RCEF 2490]
MFSGLFSTTSSTSNLATPLLKTVFTPEASILSTGYQISGNFLLHCPLPINDVLLSSFTFNQPRLRYLSLDAELRSESASKVEDTLCGMTINSQQRDTPATKALAVGDKMAPSYLGGMSAVFLRSEEPASATISYSFPGENSLSQIRRAYPSQKQKSSLIIENILRCPSSF